MIDLNPTPLTLLFGIAGLIAVAVLSWLSWKRSPHPKRSAVLEAMRMLVAIVVAVLLWQPEWLTVINPNTKPKIAILSDRSKSMTTIDAELSGDLGSKTGILARAEWVEEVLASDIWAPLEEDGKNEVKVVSFSVPDPDKPALSGTDLEGAISSLLEKEDNLRAVVLFTDADYNLGQPPVAAAQKMRLRGVPLFPIPVGSPVRLPDIDLMQVAAPSYGVIGEKVQIPFTIRSSLDRQVRTVVACAMRAARRSPRTWSWRPIPKPMTRCFGALTRRVPPSWSCRCRWPRANW